MNACLKYEYTRTNIIHMIENQKTRVYTDTINCTTIYKGVILKAQGWLIVLCTRVVELQGVYDRVVSVAYFESLAPHHVDSNPAMDI